MKCLKENQLSVQWWCWQVWNIPFNPFLPALIPKCDGVLVWMGWHWTQWSLFSKNKRTFYNETQWNSVLFIAHRRYSLRNSKKHVKKRFVSVIASKGLSHDRPSLIYLRCNLIFYVFLVWSRPLVTYHKFCLFIIAL